MVMLVACCRGAFVVAGWLAASLPPVNGWAEGSRVDVAPRVVWHVVGEGRGTPAIAGERVYFLSKRHELVAVDRASGRVRWRRPTGGPGEATLGSRVVATPSAVIVGDYDVVAFGHDGRWRWRFAPSGGYGAGVHLGEATGNEVFAGSPSGHLAAIDATSGGVRWQTRIGTDERTTVFAPVATTTAVVAGFTSFGPAPSGGLVALDRTTGRLLWRRRLPGPSHAEDSGPAMAGGPVIVRDVVVATGGDGSIHAFDEDSGQVRWSLPPVGGGVGPEVPDYRALAWTGRLLVAGSLTGVVVAFDPDARIERWRRRSTDASVALGIATDGTTVYVPHFSGHLVALDARDGREVWRVGGESGFAWMPFIADGLVFAVASHAGYFAFDAARRPFGIGRR
jgi:outer membrane protein assembly factor BamB